MVGWVLFALVVVVFALVCFNDCGIWVLPSGLAGCFFLFCVCVV